MDRIEFLSGILTCQFEYGSGTTGVAGDEICDLGGPSVRYPFFFRGNVTWQSRTS